MLNDEAIMALGRDNVIDPFDPARVQPASYDLTLGDQFLLPRPTYQDQNIMRWRMQAGLYRHAPNTRCPGIPYTDHPVFDNWFGPYLLLPGEQALGSTAERVRLPADIAARVEGRSTMGRKFLAVHVTAGFVDPGFDGHITLELVNQGPFILRLIPGMDIAQINFVRLEAPALHPYDATRNHYQNSLGVVGPWR